MSQEAPNFGDDHTEFIRVSADKTEMEIDPRFMSQGSISQILLNQIYNCSDVNIRIIYKFGDLEDEITPDEIIEARTIWPEHETLYFIGQKAQELCCANKITIEHLRIEDQSQAQ